MIQWQRINFFILWPILLACNGCCAISEYFCGPDKSHWISVSRSSHEAALATLQEALRRASAEEIYRSLSPEFIRANGEIDSLGFEKAWQLIQEQVPGIHLLGNATVVGPQMITPDLARYVLERAGKRVEVKFIRKAFWEIEWMSGDDRLATGASARTLRGLIRVNQSEPGDPQRVTIELEPDTELYRFDPSRVQRAGVGREWKVLELALLE